MNENQYENHSNYRKRADYNETAGQLPGYVYKHLNKNRTYLVRHKEYML